MSGFKSFPTREHRKPKKGKNQLYFIATYKVLESKLKSWGRGRKSLEVNCPPPSPISTEFAVFEKGKWGRWGGLGGSIS